mmetsp:Transcript_43755/g.87571  ORF Transcript_43755/g.87571 Transcript_43755/m.87571 type:complete len:104 (-) Transcript_43755:281-592(-)
MADPALHDDPKQIDMNFDALILSEKYTPPSALAAHDGHTSKLVLGGARGARASDIDHAAFRPGTRHIFLRSTARRGWMEIKSRSVHGRTEQEILRWNETLLAP